MQPEKSDFLVREFNTTVAEYDIFSTSTTNYIQVRLWLAATFAKQEKVGGQRWIEGGQGVDWGWGTIVRQKEGENTKEEEETEGGGRIREEWGEARERNGG